MKFLIIFVGFVITVMVVGYLVSLVLTFFFSADHKESRSVKKANTIALANKTRQLGLAKTALIKIAANDSGNPSLDATIALEDIQSAELRELEN